MVQRVEKEMVEKEMVGQEMIEEEMVEDEIIEEETVLTDKEIFMYSKCNFETIHKNGLKIHIKRKHAHDSKTCYLCKETFKTVREMKIHRHTHSFKECYASKLNVKNASL